MSQERTRFPIQPKDVRRSARSNRDVDVAGQPRRRGPGKVADKPDLPPHRRHEHDDSDEHQASDQAAESDED